MKLVDYLKKTSQAELAKKLGCSQGLVYQWTKKIRPVSVRMCIEIEEATEGKVTRKELRPDDWWLIWPELGR